MIEIDPPKQQIKTISIMWRLRDLLVSLKRLQTRKLQDIVVLGYSGSSSIEQHVRCSREKQEITHQDITLHTSIVETRP